MQALADLDLPLLPMDEPWFAEDPAKHFAEARKKHPWLATFKLGTVVTGYDAVRELMRMEDRMYLPFREMVEFLGVEGTPFGRFQENHILAYSGAAHRRIRDILAPAFTPRMANTHRPIMRAVIAKLLDEWVPKGKFDFEEFASYFPITVMCSLMGISPTIVPAIRDWLETLGLSVSMDKQYVPAFQDAIVKLDAVIDELVANRELGKDGKRDIPDLLDILVKAKADGGLTHRELGDLLIFLLVAGYDTSKNVLTMTMHRLLDKPDIYQKCAEDVTYARKVIEESMRFHSPSSTPRRLSDDITYRDVVIPKGTTLWIPWAIVARDALAIPNADEFKPERDDRNPHLGFAAGAHMCLGQHIARAQLEEGLHLMAQRITKPKSTGPGSWRPFTGVWGINGLPITFEPAPART
jgi:cytochrome P450